MSFLCISKIPLTPDYEYSEVTLVTDCLGYIVKSSTDVELLGLSYTDANQLIGATALLFSVTFIMRLVLKKLGY